MVSVEEISGDTQPETSIKPWRSAVWITSSNRREWHGGDIFILTVLQHILHTLNSLLQTFRAYYVDDEVTLQASSAGHSCIVAPQGSLDKKKWVCRIQSIGVHN